MMAGLWRWFGWWSGSVSTGPADPGSICLTGEYRTTIDLEGQAQPGTFDFVGEYSPTIDLTGVQEKC